MPIFAPIVMMVLFLYLIIHFLGITFCINAFIGFIIAIPILGLKDYIEEKMKITYKMYDPTEQIYK